MASNAVFALLMTRDAGSAYRFRNLYVEPVYQDLPSQMAAVNAFLRQQLSDLPEDTRRIRECLLNELDFEHWLHMLATHVLPEVLRMGLPCARPTGYVFRSEASHFPLLDLLPVI